VIHFGDVPVNQDSDARFDKRSHYCDCRVQQVKKIIVQNTKTKRTSIRICITQIVDFLQEMKRKSRR
jgi:hypothetical protein